MNKFINTKKEQFLGFDFFKKHYLPPKDEFDFRNSKKIISEFYASYGFEVSMTYADFYSKMWYPHFSDRFMSDDVYYFYVLPALNRFDFISAYMDKNGYDSLFPDCMKPKSVVKNINGYYYDNEGELISLTDAVSLTNSVKKDLIIKPSIDSGCGVGIGLLAAGCPKQRIEEEFRKRRSDFIVQERLIQSMVMSKLNASSLNTLRIMTYRNKQNDIVIFCVSVRMGGNSSLIDNASGGGGFCHVYEDGMIDRSVMRYKTLKKTTLQDFRGISPFKIPNFDRVKSLVRKLHSRLPYFDMVGWDIAIDKDENPVFIEINLTPEAGFSQMNYGPIFGDHIEEVMERTVLVKKEENLYMKLSYPNGSHRLLRL